VPNEEQSLFEVGDTLGATARQVRYNRAVPPEYFDVIVVDEGHRSIYTVWQQVLEYFDAYLIGLTAGPPTSRPSASSTATS
jgi:type I restriction enzyme, R subunit